MSSCPGKPSINDVPAVGRINKGLHIQKAPRPVKLPLWRPAGVGTSREPSISDSSGVTVGPERRRSQSDITAYSFISSWRE
eukprot:397401-Hanusia_phi.AAC.1